jgi:hypothetical protein
LIVPLIVLVELLLKLCFVAEMFDASAMPLITSMSAMTTTAITEILFMLLPP